MSEPLNPLPNRVCAICAQPITSEADQRLMGKGPAHISCFNNWKDKPMAQGIPGTGDIPEPDRPAKAKRGPDPELQAMARLDRTLAELNPDQRRRVVAWLRDKHSGYETPTKPAPLLMEDS